MKAHESAGPMSPLLKSLGLHELGRVMRAFDKAKKNNGVALVRLSDGRLLEVRTRSAHQPTGSQP